jgi:hypothetical protein
LLGVPPERLGILMDLHRRSRDLGNYRPSGRGGILMRPILDSPILRAIVDPGRMARDRRLYGRSAAYALLFREFIAEEEALDFADGRDAASELRALGRKRLREIRRRYNVVRGLKDRFGGIVPADALDQALPLRRRSG